MAETHLRAESGIQLLARLVNRPSISNLEPELFALNVIKPKDVIELRGGPGSGKTLLLTHLLAKCILPKKFGGAGAGAILINADHHFQLTRLVAMLEQLLKKGGCENSQKEVKSAMKLLTILACYDSSQLSVTLHALPQYLARDKEVSLVAFDSPSAFYWADALAEGTTRISSKQVYLRHILHSMLYPGVAPQAIIFVYTISDAFVTTKFVPPIPANATHHVVALQITSQNPETSGSSSTGATNFLASVSKHQQQPHLAYFMINSSGFHWCPNKI